MVYIDSYENGVPVGHFGNPDQQEYSSFCSFTQLLLKLEKSLDMENMPQAFENVRSFFPMADAWSGEEGHVERRKGKKATFVLHVLFRRNASWQGTLLWLNERKTQNFRSVLELIVLMNSALENTDAKMIM